MALALLVRKHFAEPPCDPKIAVLKFHSAALRCAQTWQGDHGGKCQHAVATGRDLGLLVVGDLGN